MTGPRRSLGRVATGRLRHLGAFRRTLRRRVGEVARLLPPAWRWALVVTLVLRVAVAVVQLAAGGLLPGLDPVDVPPVPGTGFRGWRAHSAAAQGWGLLGAGLERYDALWYLALARSGYPPGTPEDLPGAAAFFPGFPLLIRLLSWAGHELVVASLITLLATIAALAGLYTLVVEETADPLRARRAVLLLAVFPSAFFLVAPYSEAPMLAASVWAAVAAQRGRWGRAALLAAAAATIRNVGVLLSIWLLALAWQRRHDGALRRPTVWAAVAAPGVGLGAVAAFAWWRFGTPLAPALVQSGWQRELSSPLTAIVDAVRFGLGTPGQYATGYHTLDLVIFLPVVVGIGWLLWRRPLPHGLFALAHLLVWLTYPFPSRPLMSVPRFALVVFPLAVAWSAWTRRRGAETVWVAGSAALLGIQLALFTTWYYVF